jgi:hypothetical protein
MSERITNEATAESIPLNDRSLPLRSWAGEPGGHATHYLHLFAFPCEFCQGPVIVGWVGRRQDDITMETEITGRGAICLSCGKRPTTLLDPALALHFKPVQWQGEPPTMTAEDKQ